ncbi:putative Altered inheritance of mitochondria protein 21 [Seiridium cardinale]
MSGVRNLRAMFEQKNDSGNSPPDRGRSPGPGLPSFGSPTPPSRPLSKVRTNFVAVEKDGRVGLRRDPSGDSVSVSSRRLSNETESTTPAPIPEKTDVFAENIAKNMTSFKTNLANEPIPESPSHDSPAKLSPKKGTETPEITHGPNPDKIVDEEETKTKLTLADPTIKQPVNGKSSGLNGTAEPRDKAKSTITAHKPTTKTAAPISTSAKTTSKPLKSPSMVKLPKSPAKEASKAPEKKPTPAATKDTSSRTTTSKPAASPGKKPSTLELSPSAGFVKPKPKSPTRPAKLPSSLTQPTAAFASRLGGSAPPPSGRQSLSRASGNASASTSSQRPSSRAGHPTTGPASSGKTLKRQASTINRPRPSLGPPPKLTAKDHPPTRKEANVDESFLARMMRPTQSSSSKTSDKQPVTPPRKQPGSSTIKKAVGKDVEGSAKKAAAKVSQAVKKDSVVKKPVVAKTDVKKAVTAGAAKTAEPTAKEVAPVVAQTDSAEAAVAAAKTSKDTVATPPAEKKESEAETKIEAPVAAAEPVTEPEASKEPVAEPTQVAEDTHPTEPASSETEEPVAAKLPEAVEEEEVRPMNGGAGVSNTNEATASNDGVKTDEASISKDDVQTQESPVVKEEPKIEGMTDVKEDEEAVTPEKESTPAITANPEKVEDIEDVVRESMEPPVEKTE